MFRAWALPFLCYQRQWYAAFGAAPGRAASDAVWRQAMRAEAGKGRGQEVVTLLMDLKKCYDHVRPRCVMGAAALLQFPLVVLRVSLNSYRWRRHIKSNPGRAAKQRCMAAGPADAADIAGAVPQGSVKPAHAYSP